MILHLHASQHASDLCALHFENRRFRRSSEGESQTPRQLPLPLFGMHASLLMTCAMLMQHIMPRARISSAKETVPAPSPAWQQPARRHRCTQHACLCMHSFLDDMQHCFRHSCSMPCRAHAYCACMGPISAPVRPGSSLTGGTSACSVHTFACTLFCMPCNILMDVHAAWHAKKKKRYRRSRPDLRAGARNVP